MYETLDSIQSYDITANDNEIKYEEKCTFSLSDSANQKYYSGLDISDQIKRKLSSLIGIYKKLYIWKINHKHNDWFYFQEAAKKHHSYMIDKVIRIMRKDIKMMKETNFIP